MQAMIYDVLTNLVFLGGLLAIVKYVFAQFKSNSEIFEFAKVAAFETYEEYVRQIKDAGDFLDEDERKAAQNIALQKLITIGRDRGKDLLQQYGERWLRSIIERAVKQLKK